MILGIILFLIVIILIIYIFKMKKEIRYISSQIKGSNGEYTQIHTQALENDLEELAVNINEIYDRFQRVNVENKNMEEDLKRSIANISHDLRTPLTSMMGYVELVKSPETKEEDKKEFIEIIQRRGKNLQTLISSFYDLSRFESMDYRFNLKRLNIKEMLCDNLAVFYNDFSEKHIEPVVEMEEKPLYIIGDEKAVNRILVNLLGNIIKHGSGMARIKLQYMENQAIVSFTNSAPNLKSEDVDKLFDRFYTADISRSDKNTGLGLAISKELTEKLGGTMRASLSNGNLTIEVIWKTS